MKRFFIIIVLILSGCVFGYAQDFKAMLVTADALVNFPDSDFSAEYTIAREVPKQGLTSTSCVIFRRDVEKKYVIIVTEPKINKGQGYLKIGDTIWFYDPESRRFNTSSSRERFQNSNARNADFTESTLARDYDVVKGEKVMLGKYDCWLLHLKANNDEVAYPVMKIWISDDGLVRKAEDYSLSNQLLRTTAVYGYQKVGTKYVPTKVLFLDNLAGAMVEGKFVHEKTQVTITKPSLKKLPDSVFSKTFLESTSR
ncbi:MAG: outer membrane lipoprotein-sorting protein [Spirochaetales bacterium]|nr:outer membrane lipoprotein-sorting protein [Spirochaetales bacterium]